MHKLETAKLYGNGLVEIDSPELRSRYKECLALLGLPTTSLTRFRIDGIGWSPEIADELHNPYYLSHGDASPLGIYVTPDQQNKPVYIPFFSYQRQLTRELFNRYGREIADLTSQVGVCIELDHGISRYRSPLDLLLVRDVEVRASVPGLLLKAFDEQRALLAEFNNRDDAWFNADLRQHIVNSAREHGDLRARHLLIPTWHFSQTDYFRTSAYGGMFILRGLQKYKDVLIYEDPKLEVPYTSREVGVFPLDSPDWINLLLAEGIVKVNTDQPNKLRDDVRRLKECYLADAACKAHPNLDFPALTSAQRKGLINQLSNSNPDLYFYFELEMIELKLDNGQPVIPQNIPLEVQHVLCQPAPSLPHDKRKVICHLLSRSRTTDVWRLYRHNKRCFYEQYETWPESKQVWAIHLIRQHLSDGLTD